MTRLTFAILLLTSTVATASLFGHHRVSHSRRVFCYRSCPFFSKQRCRDTFKKGCWYHRCRKNFVYSCLGNPDGVSCARPCSRLNPCAAGQQCIDGQCLIAPQPSQRCDGKPFRPTTTTLSPPRGNTTTTIPPGGCPPDFPVGPCSGGFCCADGNTCNTTGCCGGQFPVPCGNYCCTPGSVCGQGGCNDPCPTDQPVACGNPLVCCRAGSVCGRDCNVRTTTTTIPGSGNCRCYCQDGRDCTGQPNNFCGVDSNGIPNVCGCPVNCP